MEDGAGSVNKGPSKDLAITVQDRRNTNSGKERPLANREIVSLLLLHHSMFARKVLSVKLRLKKLGLVELRFPQTAPFPQPPRSIPLPLVPLHPLPIAPH